MSKRVNKKVKNKNNDKNNLEINGYDLFFRYIILLIIGLGNLYLIYKILTPLTIYPVYFILNLFYTIKLSGIQLIFNNPPEYIIEIATACVAGAAYYLLLILNLTTPMKLRERIYSIIFLFGSLYLLNILRIIVLAVLFVNNSEAFNFTHKALWYGLSSLFVVIIWFSSVKIFKIKKIPIYSDFKSLISIIKTR